MESDPVARIASVQLTPTHDGEAALVAELAYPGGGSGRVQLDSHATAMVMARAGVSEVGALVGMPWTVLRPVD